MSTIPLGERFHDDGSSCSEIDRATAALILARQSVRSSIDHFADTVKTLLSNSKEPSRIDEESLYKQNCVEQVQMALVNLVGPAAKERKDAQITIEELHKGQTKRISADILYLPALSPGKCYQLQRRQVRLDFRGEAVSISRLFHTLAIQS